MMFDDVSCVANSNVKKSSLESKAAVNKFFFAELQLLNLVVNERKKRADDHHQRLHHSRNLVDQGFSSCIKINTC